LPPAHGADRRQHGHARGGRDARRGVVELMAADETFSRKLASKNPPSRYEFVSVNGDNKDAALAELEAAYKIIEVEEKSFSYGISIFVFAVTAIVGLLSIQSDRLDVFMVEVGVLNFYAICYSAVLTVCVLLIFVFADRCKVIALNLRKIVVFRARFRLNYRDFHWIIPNNRFEGAANPFYVPIFPGWLTYRVMPVHVICVICFFVFTFLNLKIISHFPLPFGAPFAVGVASFEVFILYITFRLQLFDSIESKYTLLAALLGRIFGPKLRSSLQDVMYESDFSTKEVQRLNINLLHLRSMAVFIEDKRFYSHNGWDFTAVIRALLNRIRRGKRSGASTITQQLARSLFLTSLRPPVSRKIIEILIAMGLELRLTKQQILDCYLCGVRYAHNQIGIAAAIRYFFPLSEPHVEYVGVAPAFFLIERISNIKSDILVPKIASQLKKLHSSNVITGVDIYTILEIYQEQIRHGRIVPSDEQALKKLAAEVKSITEGEFIPWSPEHRA